MVPMHAQSPALQPSAFLAMIPATAEVQQLRDVPYVVCGHEFQKLNLFLPASESPRPLVVWVHGGGWESGDKNDYCHAQWLVEHGYAVASLNYRLSKHAIYPAQLEDCKAAIRFLRAHASEYGINPNRIGVWGASAGGHLASLLGTTGDIPDFDTGANLDQPSNVQCVVDWFGPTDFLHYGEPPTRPLDRANSGSARLIGGSAAANPEKARRASPFYFVKKDAAPFLIMHGDKDDLVPLQQSQIFEAALKKSGVECTLTVLPGGGHDGPAFFTLPIMASILEFLDRHLKK